MSGIKDGSMVMIGGYGKLGAPHSLIKTLAKTSVKNLTVVCGIAACAEKGSAIQELLEKNKVSKLITSNVGENPTVLDLFKKGELEVQLQPMGTLAEKVRSGGYGIPAFYSPVGAGTYIEEGGVPTKLAKDGKTIIAVNLAKEKREFKGRDYLLEKTILGDYALVKAWKADTKGNCVLKLANRNFNPDMAIAGKICIVEAEEIVEAGAIDGDDIHIPGIFVHRVVKSTEGCTAKFCEQACPLGSGEVKELRELMVKRAAKEIKEGSYIVLGAGLSKAVEHFIPESVDAHIVCPETGVFGAVKGGVVCKELADGCLNPVGLRKNGAIIKTSDTFASIRGKHLNLFIVDGYQVSQEGDLANIEKGDKILPSPGIHMDLAAAETPMVVLMEMTSNGKPNLVKNCSYKVSGRKCVSKLVTDMGVFEFKADGMTLIEIAPGITVENIKSKTPCSFNVAAGLKPMSA